MRDLDGMKCLEIGVGHTDRTWIAALENFRAPGKLAWRDLLLSPDATKKGRERCKAIIKIRGLKTSDGSASPQAYLGVETLMPEEIHVFQEAGRNSDEYVRLTDESGLKEADRKKRRRQLGKLAQRIAESFLVPRDFVEVDYSSTPALLNETSPPYGTLGSGGAKFLVVPAKSDFQPRREFWVACAAFQGQMEIHGHALLCFVGAPYAGKKEVARKLAWDSKSAFPDGAIEVDFSEANIKRSPVKNGLRAVLVQFGGANSRGIEGLSIEELQQLMIHALADKRVLVVVHNVESAEQLERMVPPPSCSLLATSCSLFKLPGMENVRISSSAPDVAVLLAMDIGGGRKDFERQAARIARACSHNLYAVRLAATSIEQNITSSVASQVKELERKPLKYLAAIKLALAMRYSNLTAEQQQAWRFLSMFQSQFSAAKGGTILEGAKRSAGEAGLLLAYLAKSNLIQFSASTDTFEIIPLEREFLVEKLHEAGEYKEGRRRHAHLYLSDAGRLSEIFAANPRVLPWIAGFETADFTAAFRWASTNVPELCASFIRQSVTFIKALPAKAMIVWGLRGRKAARAVKDYYAEAIANYFVGLGLITRGEPAERILPFYQQSFEILKSSGVALKKNDATQVSLIGGTLANIFLEMRKPELWQSTWDELNSLLEKIATHQ